MSKEQKIEIDPTLQSLVLEQKYRLHDSLIDANNNLDARIDGVLQKASIILGLVTILNFPKFSDTYDAIVSGKMLQSPELLFIIIVFIIFIIMTIMSVYALHPVERKELGISDWEKTFLNYLYSDECFEQILSDLLESIEDLKKVNAYKAKWTPILSFLLIAQVIFLALALLFV